MASEKDDGVKFTKGPWSAKRAPGDEDRFDDWSVECEQGSYGWGFIGAEGREAPVAAVISRFAEGLLLPAEHAANRALISAAPDLYEALKGLLRFGELASVSAEPAFSAPSGKKPASKEVWQFPRHMLADIEAALSKAEGRTP